MSLFNLQKIVGKILAVAAICFSAVNAAVYDENRVLSAQQVTYFEQIAAELYAKTGVSLNVTLVNDAGYKKWQDPFCGKDSINIIIAFKQQWHFVKTDSALASVWTKQQIAKVQQETLIPEFRKAHYGKGILLLAYEIAKTTTVQKGKEFSLEPIEIEDSALSFSGWIFVLIVFGLVFIAGKKSLGFKKSKNTKNTKPDFNGKFGHSSNFGNG